MITANRLAEICHIAPTAGPEGQRAINELLAEVERLERDFGVIVSERDQISDICSERLDILEDLVDDNPCRFDHHGHCQEHGWPDPSPCPQARIKAILSGGRDA